MAKKKETTQKSLRLNTKQQTQASWTKSKTTKVKPKKSAKK